MKKLIQSLCLATMAAFTFNACSDVPAPYDIPGSGTQNNGVYISESFSNTLSSAIWQYLGAVIVSSGPEIVSPLVNTS